MNFSLGKFESALIRAIGSRRTVPIQIDITNLCNLRCRHCYHPHHNNIGAIELDQWLTILSQYQSIVEKLNANPLVIICGGEPLLSPLLEPILRFIATRMPQATVSILTNGTVVTSTLLSTLSIVSALRVQVSLDGPSSETHDKVRGVGSFERALQGIKNIQTSGIPVNVLATLSSQNAPFIEEFFQLAVRLNAESMNFVRFMPEGIGKALIENGTDRPLIGKELKSALTQIISMSAKYRVKSRTQGPLAELIAPGLGRSGRFADSIVIDYRGNMVASSRSKIVLGSVLHSGLEELFFNHPLFKAIRRGQVRACGTCELYSVCGGDRNAAYASTGDFLGPDPGCWKIESKGELTEDTREVEQVN